MKAPLQYLLFTVCLLFTYPKTAGAQSMSGVMEYFTITAPDEVEQYENFWVVYSLKTKVYSSFEEVEFKDFGLHKISLPSRKSYNEGHFLKTEFKYLIDSKKSGWVTLPPQTIKINGHTIQSATKKIFVKAAPKKALKDIEKELDRQHLTSYFPALSLKEKTDSQTISPGKEPTARTDSTRQDLSPTGNKNCQDPQFPGGIASCMQWLSEHIKYPAECVEKNIEGKVRVQFVVRSDGSLSNIKVIESPHPALSEEGIRVISEMPRWKPGTLDGKPVNAKLIIPLNFHLQEEESAPNEEEVKKLEKQIGSLTQKIEQRIKSRKQ